MQARGGSLCPSADPCTICGRPLPGKGKLQDCRGAWSDAAICGRPLPGKGKLQDCRGAWSDAAICGRPLPGKGKLQDCRGAWSDAAICPASGAAANRRGPVWEFADRVPNHSRVLEVRCCTLVIPIPS